jgi:hypothetical protein
MRKTHSEVVCSAWSSAAGEQLFGTLSRAPVWFLLEYDQAWGRKAYEESQLGEAVKAHLEQGLKLAPGARLQLIKGGPGKEDGGLAFFACLAHESQPQVYEFRLERYTDLLRLDFAALLGGGSDWQDHLRVEPLYLVCTNGRRDACCARAGTAVHSSLAARLPGAAWQTTHIGGHRFAANVLAFPAGVCYGRVSPRQVEALLLAGQRGEVYLEGYRGRACYPEPVQAAEYFLRQQTGERGIFSFHWIDSQESGTNHWLVRFRQSATGQEHRLEIVKETASFQVYLSCGDDAAVSAEQYRLLERELPPIQS